MSTTNVSLKPRRPPAIPVALWQLGLMYESGEGVAQDKAKAFGYFAQIADEHADTAPRGVEADIVAHSFVKMGEYYKDGLPEAGVPRTKTTRPSS